MKIISNYKDYYDYLAYQYGVDDNIIFERNRVIPIGDNIKIYGIPASDKINEDGTIPEHCHQRGNFSLSNVFYYEYNGKRCQFEQVSIVGTIYYYLLEYDGEKGNFLMRMPKNEDFNIYYQWRKKIGNNRGQVAWPEIWGGRKNFKHLQSRVKGIIQPDEPRLPYDIPVRLHQELKMPILWKSSTLPDGQECLLMPMLSKIRGFGGVCPPDSIYRNIYNFLQQMRSSPDSEPPVSVDNESQIIKHGFDLKQSFRHPVNLKDKKR